MSERKSINKYYPPDYDPSKIPKKKKSGAPATLKVRLETPYSMRCTRCNEYISKARKFNAKKEFTKEMYLKTKIYRFHITCPRCNNNITFKTSPQTAGFVPEEGAVRNYQPKAVVGPEAPETEDEILERLEREERENRTFKEQREKRKFDPFWKKNSNLKNEDGDLMENLEKKLREQQRQQQLTEELESLQARKLELQQTGDTNEIIDAAKDRLQNELDQVRENLKRSEDDEDNQLVHQAFKRFRASNGTEQEVIKTQPKTIPDSKPFKQTIVVKRKGVGSQTAKPMVNLGGYSSDSD